MHYDKILENLLFINRFLTAEESKFKEARELLVIKIFFKNKLIFFYLIYKQFFI